MTDWGLFDTPFGPRTGGVVPALLEKLDASDARVRAKALTDLHHRVVAVNGGAGPPFLPIAGALVPVLGARLAAPGVLSPQLGQVLEVLGDIAAGNHRLVAASGLPVDALDRDDIGPARENRAAVAALVAAIRARLADEDPAVRAAAAFALAWLPGEASSSVPALLARLARGVEKNAVARASALVALGYLGGPVDALRALRSEKAPVGVAAGIAAMLADPARMDDDLDVVLPELAKPVVKGFPFLDGALGRLRVVVIGGATIRRGDLAAHRALVARMPEKHRAEAAVWTVRVAAAQCSPSSSRSLEPLDPAALPEEAREALREQARAADRTPGVGAAFRRIGLFSSTPDDARALGVAPPGPLDARVDGHPLWWWLHAVRAHRIDAARWCELARAHDPLGALEDAATPAYELYGDRARGVPYDFAGLAALLTACAATLGVRSETLDARIARLHELQREVVPSHAPTLRAPWP